MAIYTSWKPVQSSDEFIIGKDEFSDIIINATQIKNFYFFFDNKHRRLIKKFILKEGKEVDYICSVALIKKGDKFSPRLIVSVRSKTNKVARVEGKEKPLLPETKAIVSLDECHENFWKLVAFLYSLRNIEIPRDPFSLVTQDEREIVAALRGRDSGSIVNIIKQLSETPGLELSQEDLNTLLKRREKLTDFRNALVKGIDDEGWWQDFFEQNKWIFGYGLNYQILRQEQSQPYYGGGKVDGTGGQRGDYLASTLGDINFTVLVEIKNPMTQLLQGTKEIRNGAWSLGKDLTDAVSQISANIFTWNKSGSTQQDNMDKFENDKVYTVEPKGIIVIGMLNQIAKERHKRETFQRFRKSLHGLDILTFDELFKRARFIVENKD